jgi:hypothetical protein
MTVPGLLDYIDDGIQRLSSGTSGSHRAGIFNKAANQVEKHVAAFLVSATCESKLAKRTLGQLIPHLEKLPDADRDPLQSAIMGAKEANDVWVLVKHGIDPSGPDLIRGMRGLSLVMRGLFSEPPGTQMEPTRAGS